MQTEVTARQALEMLENGEAQDDSFSWGDAGARIFAFLAKIPECNLSVQIAHAYELEQGGLRFGVARTLLHMIPELDICSSSSPSDQDRPFIWIDEPKPGSKLEFVPGEIYNHQDVFNPQVGQAVLAELEAQGFLAELLIKTGWLNQD